MSFPKNVGRGVFFSSIFHAMPPWKSGLIGGEIHHHCPWIFLQQGPLLPGSQFRVGIGPWVPMGDRRLWSRLNCRKRMRKSTVKSWLVARVGSFIVFLHSAKIPPRLVHGGREARVTLFFQRFQFRFWVPLAGTGRHLGVQWNNMNRQTW